MLTLELGNLHYEFAYLLIVENNSILVIVVDAYHQRWIKEVDGVPRV